VAGFALRLHGLTLQSFWRDEVDALRFAQGSAVTSLSQLGWNGPLYTWLLSLWVDLVGISEFALRYSSVLPGVLLLPLMLWLGRRLADDRAGLVAAALAATSPYLVWYAQELKMYSLLALLGAASTALLFRALDRGGIRNWAGYVAVTAAMPYIHVLGILMVPAQAVGYLAAWPRTRPRLRAFALSIGVLLLPYVPLAAWQAPLLAQGFQTGHLYYPLTDVLTILARGWTLGIVASATPWLMLPFALALAGLALAPRLDSPARFLLVWLVLPVLLVHLISLRSPIFTDRYLIASLPALILLLSLGVSRVMGRWRSLGAVLLAVLLSVHLYGVHLQSSYAIKTDARGAADIVRQGWQPGDILVLQIPYLRHSMDYYLGSGYPMLDGPFTNYGMTPEEASAYLSAGTRGYRRAWLLLSEAEMWDRRGLTEGWFHANARLVQGWELARVRLLLFDLSEGLAIGPGM